MESSDSIYLATSSAYLMIMIAVVVVYFMLEIRVWDEFGFWMFMLGAVFMRMYVGMIEYVLHHR